MPQNNPANPKYRAAIDVWRRLPRGLVNAVGPVLGAPSRLSTRVLRWRTTTRRPLVAHVLYRFDVGGLENGVVNLINQLPAAALSARRDRDDRDQRLSAAVCSATTCSSMRWTSRLARGCALAPAMYSLLRRIAPAIVHTRNLGALEMSLPAAWAGVPVRIHGEHGWDTNDPDGRSRKFRLCDACTALCPSLRRAVASPPALPRRRRRRAARAHRADLQRSRHAALRSAAAGRIRLPGRRSPPHLWLVGTVGRLQAIKDQVLLARAFVRALELDPPRATGCG